MGLVLSKMKVGAFCIISSLFCFKVTLASEFRFKVKNFYGLSFDISIPKEFISEPLVDNFYDPLYEQRMQKQVRLLDPLFKSHILAIQEKYHFSDWLTFLLSVKIVNALGLQGEKKTLGAFAVMRVLDYNVTVVKKNNKLLLALPINKQVYNSAFLKNGKTFYLIYDVENETMAKYRTSKVHFFDIEKRLEEQKTNVLDLNQVKSPLLPKSKIKKTLTWSFQDKAYRLDVSYNKNLLDYFKSYPQLGIAFYFSLDASQFLKKNIVAPLKQVIEDSKFSERDALDFLLSFCLAMPYKEDNKTSYGERCNFPEETIFALYSDCEDRSVLLNLIVMGVLNLKTVGLRYDSHISLAVAISNPKASDYRFKDKLGNVYIYCDPSFFNSKSGEINNLTKGKTPALIKTK